MPADESPVTSASPRTLEVEISVEKSKRYKSPGINQVLSELIDVGAKILHFEVHRLTNWD